MAQSERVGMPPELRAVSSAQLGIVTRKQALAHGLSPEAVRHALGPHGEWQKVMPGVYATFSGALREEHLLRAALLRAGSDAALTGAHACRRYGMKYGPEPTVFEVLVPQSVIRVPIRRTKIIRTSSGPRTRTIRGIRTASPERAALDSARSASDLQTVRAVLCEVVQRRLATTERVAAELSRVDPRGMGLARRAVADLKAGCRSAPECELRDLVRASTVLTEPVWNQQLPGADDIVPDGYIEEARLVLEVESMEHHQFGDAPERTERRRARLASLGWRVYPVSPRRLREEPSAVLAEIEEAARTSSVHAA